MTQKASRPSFALHLDRGFTPYAALEEVQYEAFVFAGGEPHIKLEATQLPGAHVHITQRTTSFNDLGLLAVTCDALRRAGAASLELTLPYFPGARQDRVMVPGEPLTAKVYATFINQLSLKQVTVFDPHSDVVPALLNAPRVISNVGFAKRVLGGLPAETFLVSPDAGALKKVYAVAAAIGEHRVIEGSKHRDVRTGALSGFSVSETDLNRRPCLILDDICDGGGTFVGLAEALRNANAGDLYLAVSHGIFSRGLDELAQVFTKVYCTDAFSTPPVHAQLEVVPLDELLPDS